MVIYPNIRFSCCIYIRLIRCIIIRLLCRANNRLFCYTGRDNRTSHRGMGITNSDWLAFIAHLQDTLVHFNVPETEKSDVITFIESTKSDIID